MRMPVRMTGSAKQQFDVGEHLPRSQAHAARGIHRGRRDPPKPDDRVGDDGQQRIEEQGNDCRRRADATDPQLAGPRHRRRECAERHHENAEQRDRGIVWIIFSTPSVPARNRGTR